MISNKPEKIISPGDRFKKENNDRLGEDVVREGFLEDVTTTQKLNKGEGARHADLGEGHTRQRERP